uniref:Dicer-like protein n=1 Tax=Paramecium multimicronucleatum TaxID=44030 RepID=W1I756_9CILI|nr:Dicer-like protein [Paramecium multimicronucleatum]
MCDLNNVQSIGFLPPQLTNPYRVIEEGRKVLLFLNYFEIDNQMLIILTPQHLEYSMLSKPKAIEQVRPRYQVSQKLLATAEQFKSIVSFNILLFGDLYQTNASSSASKQARGLETFLKELQIPQLNLLIVPGVYKINFEQIYEYLEFKLSSNKKHYEPGGLVYTDSPYRIFNVLFEFDRETPLIDFFYQLIDSFIYKDLEEIQNHFNISTIGGTLFNFLQTKESQNISSIKRKWTFNQETKNFVMLQQMKHINQMHQNAEYINNICHDCQSEKKCTFLQSKSKQIFVANQDQLQSYSLAIQFVDLIGRVFQQLICQMVFYANSQNASIRLQKLGSLERIEEAISCPSYNQERNYQNLEVLGDSVIKYLTSAMLFENPQHKNESILSHLRIKFITNNHLSNLYEPLQIHTMNGKIHYKKIRNHMIATINDRDDFKLSKKQLADIYEAFCGACYLKRYEFKDVLKYFQLTNFGFQQTSEIYCQGSAIISFDDCVTDIEYPLKNKIQQRPFASTTLFNQPLQEFEEQLGCSLKNLQEAMTVGDYERLEFLGDAILELLIVVNVHKECEKHYYTPEQQQMCREGKLQLKLLLCPGMLHTLKISLLDNGFMGTMALYYNFHQYAQKLSNETQKQIENVLEKLRQEDFSEFRKVNEYSAMIPKVMSDLWESVAACILIEHGWEGVVRIYGEIYKPYILYLVDNISLIYDYYQEVNRNIQIEKN